MIQKLEIKKSFLPITLFIFVLTIGLFSPATSYCARSGGDAFIGIVTHSLDDFYADDIDYDGEGVVVSKVVRRSAARKAGLQRDDVIIRIGERKIKKTKDIDRAIWRNDPGDEVEIEFWRDGKIQTITLTLMDKDRYYDKKHRYSHSFDDDDYYIQTSHIAH